MARQHLFEFEDQSWFPSTLRNYGTDFLQFLANKSKMFSPTANILHDLMQKTGVDTIIDLASGGGGSWETLFSELKQKNSSAQLILTDYYPNFPALEKLSEMDKNISFSKEKVDARNVPASLQGIRTQYLSFHHFNEKDAIQILEDAVKTNQPIAIFEGQERSVLSVMAMIFSPITVLLTTLLMKPFRWGRILFTYLIPIVPFFVMWDGIVSSIRTYSVEEMKKLVLKADPEEKYYWEIKRIKNGPGVIISTIGHTR
ncbi:hypothetical protein [Flammeovirga agarivorans]|uniref:Class I SAM-dependent methyltransferase n=1 Tax=Flammeovirga agarivorans TaxID=2726742 RepID=A0A7X8XW65_9BACT|nr:hypothetical protein [Flammeovirga agarivorans]NLR91936.1 hypothetical protein [Flammeovirga agarivorans]